MPRVVEFLNRLDARYGIDSTVIAERSRRVVEERRIARAVLEAERTATLGEAVVMAPESEAVMAPNPDIMV